MIDRNELLAETEELADLIIKSPEIQAYQEAEADMNAHPKAKSMLQKLKNLQEEVGEFQARRVPPKHYIHLLKDSESLMADLEKIPEVMAFQRAQNEVNELLQSVTNRLAKAVLSKVTDQAK